VALLADMAVVYVSLNLNTHVTAAAQARLERSARHYGRVAGLVYLQHKGWTGSTLTTLRRLAAIDDLAVKITDPAGGVILSLPANAAVERGASATAPVAASGSRVGEVTVSQSDGRLLTAEETRLRRALNRVILLAGGVSAVVALAVALYLAWTLSRPLRRIRASAEAMGSGRLDARVEETGDEEIRSVARALNRLGALLEHEEELRKQSVDNLAHELRTPVMGLLGRVEAIQDGLVRDPAANAAAMRGEVLRLSRLVDELSALTEAERPGVTLDLEPVDLAAAAATQVIMFRDRFDDKGVTLSEDLAAAFVQGDARRLQQIVANLLSNALRYTDPGGRVTVTVGAAGSDAVLKVADTGIGIPTEDLPRVFTRFWRSDTSRSRATGGAGLGLAIAQELVLVHDGSISVESSEGSGSVFRVRIPLTSRRPRH
jgi:signal transduction histidine kinase